MKLILISRLFFQNSSEKESTTDLSSSSPPSTKRPIESGDASEDTNEPSAKKLKTCEGADNSTDASEAATPVAAPPSGPPEEAAPPQVAV